MNAWTIWPRGRDLTRNEPIHGWEKLEIEENDLAPGYVQITGPLNQLATLLAPDGGIVLDDPNNQQIFSGRTAKIFAWAETDQQTGITHLKASVLYVEDNQCLWTRIVWPEPKKVLTDGKVTTFTGTHDKRTGKAETAIKDMVMNQIGPLAQAARIEPQLYIPPTAGLGPQVTLENRFGILGEYISQKADEAGYRIRVTHDETGTAPRLKFEFKARRNLAASVLFGTTASGVITGYVSDWSYEISAPTATYAVVAAQGEMADRQIIGIGPDAAAETLWGYRREMLVDQRQADATDTSGQAEAIANARTRLAEAATPTQIAFTVTDGPDVKYREDYDLGDTVSIELPGFPIEPQPIRQVTTTIETSEQGTLETRRMVIGSPGATENTTSSAIKLSDALKQIRNLERK